MTLSERAQLYISSIEDLGGEDIVGTAQLAYIVESITRERTEQPLPENAPVDLDELAWGFESLGIDQFRRGAEEEEIGQIFDWSFRLRSAMFASGTEPEQRYLWLLVAAGLASHNHPQLREILSEEAWNRYFDGPVPEDWGERVLWESSKAMFYLTRKQGGWRDIDAALAALANLTALQASSEPEALAAASGTAASTRNRLLGLYHLAEGLTILGTYLKTGSPESVLPTIQRHTEHCRTLLRATGQDSLNQIGGAASVILPTLVRGSIWHNTARLSEAAREFARHLAGRADGPVLELWWAQRQALAQSLLDPFKVAVGVELPTSAGKTLLAEFAIVQTMALNPNSTVAYIVPTRALVNQITRRLRRDLADALIDGRSVVVESAVPVFELDPTENQMLAARPDILVTTPEKLDLLVRSRHPCVDRLSLIVVDEAHHISDPSRGPRLELLLATVKRERGVSCRFLLLTPFMPNARDLSAWLGEEEHAAIRLDWRPSLQIRAVGEWRRSQQAYWDVLRIVPSATQPSVWDDHEIMLGRARFQPARRSRPKMAASMASALADRGSATLILTRGPGTAEERALEVAEIFRESAVTSSDDGLLRLAIEYVRAELGEDYPLVSTLSQGVAFHHAGVPPEVRALVEVLLDRGLVRVVTGTTTLAQGVDFPLSSVIVETLTMPQGIGRHDRPLLHSEFWNIVGRAGRALKDRVGLVIRPCVNGEEVDEFKRYLRGEASKLVSALLQALVGIEDTVRRYDLGLVRRNPALSYFLQYLTHALRVAGYARASAEVEDILRSSLVFRTLSGDDRELAERLIDWSRGFLAVTRDRSFIEVADSTGLSLPSVGLLAGATTPEMREPDFWLPENIFGGDLDPLASVVDLIAALPEMSLGLTNERGGLNARRVAQLLHGWVNGLSVPDLAEACFPNEARTKAIRTVSSYLFREMTGQLPWGLGALQLVATDGRIQEGRSDLGHIPAMAYYGVKSPSAVAVRMVGVPRSAAEALAEGAPAFSSFGEARQWVADRPDSAWESAGVLHGVSGSALKAVWSVVSGIE